MKTEKTTKRYTVTLKVFNDDDPRDNEKLSILADFDTYADAHEYLQKRIYDEVSDRVAEEVGNRHAKPITYNIYNYGGHVFDNGIHLSFMISDKEKMYDWTF